jgi:ribosomal protein S18 acetylase RimI-like enzyme
MNPVIIIRLDESLNFSELYDLSLEFFMEYERYNDSFFEIEKLDKESISEYFGRYINSNERFGYIASINGSIIGYITFYIKEQPSFYKIKMIGDISGLMVSEKYRRKGIAKKLMDKAIECFRENHIEYFTLFTSEENKSALGFYSSMGMKTLQKIMIGRVEKIYSNNLKTNLVL